MLALASLATCLKILRSKAALCKAPSLAGNVEATLNFIQENSIELPDAVRKRMLELQSNLSSPPPKRLKLPRREQSASTISIQSCDWPNRSQVLSVDLRTSLEC